jgi:hypothetical protein
MKRNKELEQQLLNTLDQWERAYTGYALMAVAPSQQRTNRVGTEPTTSI